MLNFRNFRRLFLRACLEMRMLEKNAAVPVL
jgi:hypothetical protein